MKKENVPAYELVSCQDIPDIHSKGSLWRHKKAVPELWCWKMMMKTKCSI